MKINRNNYELYFLDYLDGNLSDRDIHMLEDFLLINPDLRSELEGTEKISLHPDNIEFDHKEYLKHPDLTLPVNENNLQDFCIASAEGDLNEQQRSGLGLFTRKHPEALKTLNFFMQLHLIPDKSIIFPGKQKLKKFVILIPRDILYPSLSIAASILFMLIIYFRSEKITQNIPGMAADLPAVIISRPDTNVKESINDIKAVQKTVPQIYQSSVIAAVTPKEKKQTPVNKSSVSPDKNNEDQKHKDPLHQQRLNPSIQIKLPSLADNTIYVPTIDGGQITYSPVSVRPEAPEYLSISEYARQQLTAKVIGTRERENARITAWELADAGITGINKLTGGEMKLEKRIDEDGSVSAYSFDSKLLSFSTTSVK